MPRFPDVRGLLTDMAIVIIGNSPSMNMLDDPWTQLARPGLITVGINRVLNDMVPTIIWMADSGFIKNQYVRRTLISNFMGPRFFSWKHCGRTWKHYVPFEVRDRPKPGQPRAREVETQSLKRLNCLGKSDLQALQVFHGIMGAKATYLVGVDHQRVDGRAHYGYAHRQDEDMWEGKDVKNDLIETSTEWVHGGYEIFADWLRTHRRPVFTMSPVEDTIVRKFLPYVPFERGLDQVEALNHGSRVDWKRLVGWEPMEGK